MGLNENCHSCKDMPDELFPIQKTLHHSLNHVKRIGVRSHGSMDTSRPSGVVGRIRRFVLFATRGAVTLAESVYDVVVLRIGELSPGGRVRLRFLVYLGIILTLNYFTTIGMTSSPTMMKILRYNSAITKLSLSYIAGYLFVSYISQRLNPLVRHLAIVTIPSMLTCLLEEEVLWQSYKITFCSFLFLMYVSTIVPRQDSMGSIGPVTVIISMSSMYLSLLLYVLPDLVEWQLRMCHMSWYFGMLLAAAGLILDDLQVVMGSSAFPVGLVKRRARKYAYVIFAYYLVLYYSIAKLLALQN